MSGTPWLLQGADYDLVLAKPFTLSKLVESVKSLSHADGFPPYRPQDRRAAAGAT
jgi:hypothetical protein